MNSTATRAATHVGWSGLVSTCRSADSGQRNGPVSTGRCSSASIAGTPGLSSRPAREPGDSIEKTCHVPTDSSMAAVRPSSQFAKAPTSSSGVPIATGFERCFLAWMPPTTTLILSRIISLLISPVDPFRLSISRAGRTLPNKPLQTDGRAGRFAAEWLEALDRDHEREPHSGQPGGACHSLADLTGGGLGWSALSPGRCCRGAVPARNHCCHSAELAASVAGLKVPAAAEERPPAP
jgi:hypothetical protein